MIEPTLPASGVSRLQALGFVAFAALLLALTAWIYWPGVTGPELLDDRSSILVIGDLQENPDLAWDFVLGDSSGLLGRSVSMASFVLEKLYLDQGIAGSKKVNIVLHLLNGSLVIWLLWLLFRYLDVPGYRWLAIILGSIWLLQPLFVSTVLYIVQRMAMLSTFFILLGCIAYVYWRVGLARGKPKLLLFSLVVAAQVMGLLSKENAIVLIPILLLLEALWFQCRDSTGVIINWLQVATYGLIATGGIGLLAVLVFQYKSLADRFIGRSFSLEERLLTESRIVWDYVGQLLWPDVSRMGLYHDDTVVSHSLLEPATTGYSVFGWVLLLLVSVSLLRWKWGRYLVFGVAWFAVGHSVESTVLPLEMYFEHRNYFPAVGLLLSLGVAYGAVVRRWPEPKAPLLVCIGACALVLSALTSSQVQIWSNRSLLILNHLNGHPNSPRANTDMAVQMARLGQIDAALDYSGRAFEFNAIERSGDYEVRNLALTCIANKPVPDEMVVQLGRTDPNRPFSSVSTLLSMVRLVQDNACPGLDSVFFADRMAEIFLVEDFRDRGSANIYSSLAVLENALERYDNAYAYVERFLALSPGNKRGLLMKLHFSTALGKTNATREVIATLQQLDRQGKLTVGEQKTLGLYLEK